MSRIKSYYYDERTEELKLTRVFSSILAFWVLSGVAFLFFYRNRGEFGDMFGSVNTLFSGLAFGGIIYTIFQQKVELKLQRQELKLQRQEVERTNQELANQVEAMNGQRFESTFFNMISIHHQLVGGISIVDGAKNTIVGRNVFDLIFHRLERMSPETLEIHLGNEFKQRRFILNHYFCNLLEIQKLVDESPSINDEQRSKYFDTLTAQISPAEGMVIFYYLLWSESEEKMDSLKRIIKDCRQFVSFPHKEYWDNMMS
ncbi:putative phage abortive infection protein [Yersinia pestis]|uniref:putative phage abortive infection protein n=1 Tax=Paenibacillus lautus TaxID=1401 RepID=UPI00256B15AD|nr:putative phage abortive infection protein [Paenibacillus lautus]MDL1163020.1 putative phage abortive infection protein [Yersinia pestis]MEC0257716.1 putative phage abortive infection protein [Paenibacillus lautus]